MELHPPLLHLSFQTEETRLEVLRRGLKESVSEEALELGKKYQREIESAYHPKISVKFISKQLGYGVFARERIKKGAYVGEYTGVVRENVRTYFAPLNNYCYKYPVLDRLGRPFVIDATKGNFTRYINHSYQPNLKPLYAFIEGFYHLIFLSLGEISQGDQLLYDYGQSYWAIRIRPESL
jgi:SET domain-containing protein